MKKGFIVTLLMVSVANLGVNVARANAPVIDDPGDVVIGDNESGAANNDFNFPDAFDLNGIVSDDSTPDNAIKWSYSTAGNITINGATALNLGVDDPNNPPAGARIDQIDGDTGNPGQDADPYTVTFRNEGLSPNAGGPAYADPAPGFTGILTSQTASLTLYASDCSTYGVRVIEVFTASNSTDTMVGGLEPVFDLDLENDPNTRTGWIGGVTGGSGSTSSASGGLCMTVPDPGNNVVAWISPPNFITLVADYVYRTRLTLSTTQTAADQIPFLNCIYNNLYFDASFNALGNNYGGEAWILDVDGGAQGIGRPQGRTDYDFWMTPNAALTPQWNGDIDAANSAFDSSVDSINDINLMIRVLDLAGAAINAGLDDGTICVRRVRVDRAPWSSLNTTLAWGPPINTATHAAEAAGQAGAGSSATIDDPTATANYNLNGSGAGSRKTLLPFDPLQDNGVNFNLQLYPLVWNSNEVFEVRAQVRSNVPGGVEGTDPVDLVQVVVDVPNVELGQAHYTTKGSAGNFLRAASPRLKTTTDPVNGGVTPTYIGYFSTQNATASATLDANRFRGLVEVFNAATIGNNTDGLDEVSFESLSVHQVDTSGF
jgi:hypothetical protein